ncbi:hypothetical protein P692DRAFT_20753939 [Suillus brevipes Sb2]|nr:hypothetical protein P692DRAFT_20753939 [Suillus brevipes Sb2]
MLIVDISQSGQHEVLSASTLQCLQASTTHKWTMDLVSFSTWKQGSSACCANLNV